MWASLAITDFFFFFFNSECVGKSLGDFKTWEMTRSDLHFKKISLTIEEGLVCRVLEQKLCSPQSRRQAPFRDEENEPE